MDARRANPGTRALRKGRYSEPNRAYLVTAVVSERRPVFRDWRAGRRLVQVMRDLDRRDLCESLAWVIMPDHLHWLFQLGEKETLPSLIRRLKGASARQVNRVLGCAEPLWQPGFHDRALRREEDLKAIARYILANPLRAGIARRLGDYPLWDAVWL
jgi:REP element-mobilizing transposase RayT